MSVSKDEKLKKENFTVRLRQDARKHTHHDIKRKRNETKKKPSFIQVSDASISLRASKRIKMFSLRMLEIVLTFVFN